MIKNNTLIITGISIVWRAGLSIIVAALIFLSILTGVADYSFATSVYRFTMDDLCRDAEIIVVARCVDVSTEWDADQALTYTRTTFLIDEVLKGEHAAITISVRMPGGVYEDQRTVVPGIPTFEPDEDTVVFLTRRDSNGYPWIMGLGQGCYRILEDPATGELMVYDRPEENEVYNPDTGKLMKKSSPSQPQTLLSFKNQISRLLGKPATQDREQW